MPALEGYARVLFVMADSAGVDLAEAVGFMDKLARLQGGGPMTYHALGKVLYQHKDYSGVISKLQNPYRQNALDPKSQYYLGLAYCRTGDLDMGKKILSDAPAIQANDPLKIEAREFNPSL